ncbi:unnamed protein product [Microthlaspi erraticum]|uniref:Uncharacterized protein n=1 Tax=Microthlaspi erraticum TaxID=1685480 RepID=A0A6D2K2U8_9BRAS|nr:unnamed protein product [Microthlaspi erraticum]
MDFIKTSSLRALIELTFQRKWNGLIWMSRKGVIAKRVKTVQRLYRESRPSRAERPAEERMFRLGQNLRPSRPKFNRSGRYASRPGKQCPRSATPHHSRCRARPCRASREATPRGRATYSRTTADAPSEPGSHARPAEKPSANPSPSDHSRPTEKSSGHDRSDTTTTRCPADRVRTPRSTRSRF